MGCGSSSTQVSGVKSSHNSSPSTPRKLIAPSADQIIKDDFVKICSGVSHLPKPPAMVPIVCFGKDSFPLAVAPLCLDEGDTTNVNLPIIGVTRAGPGRVCIAGQLQLFVQCTSDVQETSVFLENLIRWAACFRPQIRVMLLDLPQHITQFVKKNMSGFGFVVIADQDARRIFKVNVVICASNCKYRDDIEAFLKKGGGLIIGAVEKGSDRFSLNSVVNKYGVGFPPCPLNVGPFNAPTVRLPHYSELKQFRFPQFVEMLEGELTQAEINFTNLDTIVTSLRYHLMIMPQEENENVLNLGNLAYKYLVHFNHKTEKGLCPDLIHGILSVLLTEAQGCMVAKYYKDIDFSDIYPGKTGKVELEEKTIDIVSKSEGWITTGLWLPPGKICHVKASQPIKDFIIQVGSHTENIVSMPGPWKRWPLITTNFTLKEEPEIDIATGFGGIIYIVPPSTDEIEFTITFSEACLYPQYSTEEPNLWPLTKDLEIPLGEIITKHAIFTLPPECIKEFDELDKFTSMIDRLCEEITKFTADTQNKHFRVVFDTELPEDGPVCGYPIILHLDTIPDLFQPFPTSDLFYVAICFAIVSLPDNTFEQDQEALIAHVAACHGFLALWPDKSPLESSQMQIPPYFNDLWNVYHQNGKDVFPKAMAKARQYIELSDNVEPWALFVQELSIASKIDLSNLVKAKKTEQRNEQEEIIMSMSSMSLQSYVLSDDDLLSN